MDRLVELLAAKQEDCLIFVNLVDFDITLGPPPITWKPMPRAWRSLMPEFAGSQGALQEGDLLFILADPRLRSDHNQLNPPGSMCPCWWWARVEPVNLEYCAATTRRCAKTAAGISGIPYETVGVASCGDSAQGEELSLCHCGADPEKA